MSPQKHRVTFIGFVPAVMLAWLACGASQLHAAPGMKSADSAQDASAMIGRWSWTLAVGPSGGNLVMDVKQVGEKIEAIVTKPDGKRIRPQIFEVKNGKVRLRIVGKKGFIRFTLSHSGELKGDTIRGEYEASGGPINKRGKWHATRVKTTQR